MGINPANRIKWKGTELGDYAEVSFSYQGNTDIRIIPRATGVKIWSTYDLGGGYLKININAVIVKDSRVELEQYFYNLNSVFTLGQEGDLVITYGDTTLTLTDCYLESFSQEDNELKSCRFTMSFLKSV